MRLVWAFLLAASLPGADISFNLAALRVLPERWNKEANFKKLDEWARRAARQGAQLVVTPEGFLEGYVGNHNQPEIGRGKLDREKYFAVGEALGSPLLQRVRALAQELNIYLLLGFAERRGDQMFNSLVVYGPGGALVTRYSKSHTADDEPYNTKGSEFPVVDTPLGRWGTLICMDRQLPETSRILAIKGAQIILVPAWGMYGETNEIMMRTRAYENSVWVAFVHPKRTLIIDPKGVVVARDTDDGDQIVMARVVLDERIGRGPIRYRRPEIYGEILAPGK